MINDQQVLTFQDRVGRLPSRLELKQLEDMKNAYGEDNVLAAIKFANTPHIKDIARMLLQHCGFREELSEALRTIMPDKEAAKKIFPYEKYMAGCRLETATRSLDSQLDTATKALVSVWKEKRVDSSSPSPELEKVVRNAISNYGSAFSQACIDLVLQSPIKLEVKVIHLYNDWLDYASSHEVSDIRRKIDAAHLDHNISLEFPRPVPFRLEKYFAAKADRPLAEDEKLSLYIASKKHAIDTIVHFMSCIPSSEFSLEKSMKDLGYFKPPTHLPEINNRWHNQPNRYESAKDEDEWMDNEEDEEYENYGYSHHEMEQESEYYDYSTFDENGLDSDEYI